LVGLDEADLNKGKISWVSPVAKALIKSRVGDAVELKTPAGVLILKILAIKY
jgi:transcription elongation factor GreB